MSVPVRINEELYESLSNNAKANGRSIIKQLEIVLDWYFTEVGEKVAPQVSSDKKDAEPYKSLERYDFCTHGANPYFCKFKPQNKPCK